LTEKKKTFHSFQAIKQFEQVGQRMVTTALGLPCYSAPSLLCINFSLRVYREGKLLQHGIVIFFTGVKEDREGERNIDSSFRFAFFFCIASIT